MLWLLALLPLVSGQEERCCNAWGIGCFNTRPPFDHLPLPGCPDEVQPNYNLYTRRNRNNRQPITSTSIPPAYSGSRRTMFLIHGFTNSRDSEWLINLKNEVLDNFDWNVIVVGWAGGAQTIDYPWAASNTRVVGAMSAVIARNLISNGGSAASRMYCVGHSLGAHSCGHFGKRLRIGRITGMDPAGPMFDEYNINCGLTQNDATWVDVIHSGGQRSDLIDLGTMRAMGDADFYPNNGGQQPGCDRMTNSEDPEEQICDHGISRDYMAYSFRPGCRFTARSRCTDWRNIPGSCSSCGGACQSMGYPSEANGRRGLFNPATGASPPYCLG